MDALLEIVDTLLISRESRAFREPVDWEDLGLVDYPEIIKNPMDLGTVRQRLQEGGYNTPVECAEDVRLIWSNCLTYNCDGKPEALIKAAETLNRRFEARFAKLAEKNPRNKRTVVTPVEVKPPTEDARCRVRRFFARARMEQITAAVHEIDRRCPAALTCDGDVVAIDVDGLDPRTFVTVEHMVVPPDVLRTASRGNSSCGHKRPASAEMSEGFDARRTCH